MQFLDNAIKCGTWVRERTWIDATHPNFFFYLWKYFGRNFGKFEWDNFLSYTISKTYAVFEQALFVNEKCLLIFWQNFQFRVIVVPVYWLENCIHVNSNCCSHISWLSYVLGYLLLLSLYISSLHFSFLLVLHSILLAIYSKSLYTRYHLRIFQQVPHQTLG